MVTKTVKRAYKYRFYPTSGQARELERTWGCVRVTYNKALDLRTRSWRDSHENVSYLDTAKLLTQWRHSEELGFLSEVAAVPLQQSLRHLQQAFNNFWKRKPATLNSSPGKRVFLAWNTLGLGSESKTATFISPR